MSWNKAMQGYSEAIWHWRCGPDRLDLLNEPSPPNGHDVVGRFGGHVWQIVGGELKTLLGLFGGIWELLLNVFMRQNL